MKLGLSVAAAVVSMLAVPGYSLAQTDEPDSVTYVERAASDAVLDLGAKGDSAGDVLTFANDVYDQTNKTKVGTDNGWCIRTVPGKAWECFWTLTLSDGQITTQGPFLDSGDSVMAVTGGTGEYSNVGGEMKLHSRDAKGSEYDFTYTIEDNDEEEKQQ
jgi:allene oxide cyclase